MISENKKLGRGLGALLSSGKNEKNNQNFKLINISEIKANKDQPRKDFKKEELEELASSIKSKGVLQPIVVRKKEDQQYEIIAGERRWRGAQIAGLHEIPALVKTMTDNEAQEAALIENIQRENLNAVEEARAYKKLLDNQNTGYDSLSTIIGKSKSHISNMLRLLELDDEILNYIIEGKLSMGHARALIGVPNANVLAKEIINRGLHKKGCYFGFNTRFEYLDEETIKWLAKANFRFILIGLEIIILFRDFNPIYLILSVITIIVVVLSRGIGVFVPIKILSFFKSFEKNTAMIITWGGLRGGLSIALALNLPDTLGDGKSLILILTYAVVLFTILVQGLSMNKMVKSLS